MPHRSDRRQNSGINAVMGAAANTNGASLACLWLTCCCVARSLTSHRLVLAGGLGVGDLCRSIKPHVLHMPSKVPHDLAATYIPPLLGPFSHHSHAALLRTCRSHAGLGASLHARHGIGLSLSSSLLCRKVLCNAH